MSANILVPLDFSAVSDSVVAEASTLARAMNGKLWLIHVGTTDPGLSNYEIEVGAEFPRDRIAEQLREQHRRLQEYLTQAREEGIEASALLVHGDPEEKILREAHRLDADMIVMGSHGHGALYNLVHGSVCHGVVKLAPCPVTVVRSPQPVHA